MREVVIEYETVEREEERVFCDDCGSECTDDHAERPSQRLDENYNVVMEEVCPSCSTGNTVDVARRVSREIKRWRESNRDWEDLGTDPIFALFMFVVIFPVGLVVAAADLKDGADYGAWILYGVLGMALWGGLVVSFVL